MRKKLVGLFFAMLAAFSFSAVQAAQIDGLQTNSGPALPSTLDVYVNPGDLGDALIGGYFNARNAFNRISLVNTNDQMGVVVKVRFREGKYSNEVLDFFVCLSAGDRWTAWVVGDDDPDNPAVIIKWDDDTPTYPAFPSDDTVSFKYAATGAASCVTADMTKEGYFTIIAVAAWYDSPGAMKTVATDGECGETLGLADVDDFERPELVDATNSLFATNVIYDVTTGAATYGYNLLALADFRDTIVSNPGLGLDDPPTLAQSQDGLNGVNYVLTKSNLYALYDIEAMFSGQSDVIITFPTKKLTLAATSGTVQNPFAGSIATDDCGWDDACEIIDIALWDDEENKPEQVTGFSPQATTQLELCNEVNYITMGDASAVSLLDTDLLQFKLGEPGFELGWVNFGLTGSGRSITLPSVASPEATAFGLPAMGYELGSLVDEALTHMLPLRYKTDICGGDEMCGYVD